jgi:hypothetical protein
MTSAFDSYARVVTRPDKGAVGRRGTACSQRRHPLCEVQSKWRGANILDWTLMAAWETFKTVKDQEEQEE